MPQTASKSLKAIVDQIFADRRISRQIQRELMNTLLSQPTSAIRTAPLPSGFSRPFARDDYE
jgi:hypothetical protein